MEEANSSFEQQWANAFEGAEIAPPAQLWVAVDGQLANSDLQGYKQTASFYKRLAAACLLLTLLFGGYQWNATQLEEVASKGDSNATPDIKESQIETNATMLIAEEENENERSSAIDILVSESKKPVNVSQSQKRIIVPAVPNSEIKSQRRYMSNSYNLITIQSIQMDNGIASPPKTVAHLYGVPQTWLLDEETPLLASLWAGVSYSAGAFDPGFSSGNSAMELANMAPVEADPSALKNIVEQPQYAKGQSVVGGFDVGKQISKRIVLSGGLHYSAFSTGSGNSTVLVNGNNNAFAPVELASDSDLKEAFSNDNEQYSLQQAELSNQYQYLTVPIKAGYIVLDKKIDIILNTGISSNFLIGANVVAENVNDIENEYDNKNAYQSVYFNFLTSVSFGYTFREKYQLLMEPNYSQALNDFTNSTNTNHGKPSNLGLSIGLRYNF
jgi:hypothetical protein